MRQDGTLGPRLVQEKREEAHLVQGDDDAPALLMAWVRTMTLEPERFGGHVFLKKERAKVRLGDEADLVDVSWYLDTGASNHMTGDCTMFADLDDTVTISVKFSDESVIGICIHGAVMFAIRDGEHRALTHIYYVDHALEDKHHQPRQLNEAGCPTLINVGDMSVRDWDK